MHTDTSTIWADFSADLRRFLRRRVADDHIAEDLLQETYLRIHRSIASLADDDRLAAWVYRIARNVVHDHFRQASRSVQELGDAEVASESEATGGSFLSGSHLWLGDMIAKLPERYGEAIRLSEIEGLSQQEVAERLGLSLSGAKSRIQRGPLKLKSLLEQCCTFEFDRRGNLSDGTPRPDRGHCQGCDEDGAAC